jgi:NADH dehydrogenase/NADH:ubiquinone oxidoreductase subunit G
MVTDNKPSLVTINVDGVEHQVPAGANLVDALGKIGKEVPHYCYHPKLPVAGNCRMCLVELGSPMRDRATERSGDGERQAEDRLAAPAGDRLRHQRLLACTSASNRPASRPAAKA